MKAPATVAPALADGLRQLLDEARASPSAVPGGILAWWGRSDFPDGRSRVPVLGQQQWQGAYFLIENAALAKGTVRPLPAVQAAARKVWPDEPVPIAIANFRLAVPRPEFARRVRAAGRGARFHRPPRHVGEVIEERRAFLATGLLHDQWGRAAPVHRGRTVQFVVDEQLLLTSTGDPLPDSIEVDAGDGRGFRQVEVGVPFEASYPDADHAVLTVRCSYRGHGLEARLSVAIGDEPAPPRPDDTWRLQAPGGGNTGTAWVYRAPGHAELRNRVILVEWFPVSHPCAYMYELLNQQGLVERLRAGGHDVVIVGLDQGTDLIQRNAPVVIECIREAMRRTDAPLVVGGVSMGGIVSRYALARMESVREEHHTRTFVSIDSPHGGTYTSLGVQWFVHALLPFAPALGGFAALIDSPSNQQLIMYWLHDGAVAASPLREQLLRDLDALGGWPQKPRRIAVSCGRGDGVGNGSSPGQNVLMWKDEPFVSVAVNTLAADGEGTVAEGSWFLGDPVELPKLVAGDGVPWDGAPGAQGDYHGRISAIAAGFGCGSVRHTLDSTCSVPAVNALALDQGAYEAVPAAGSGCSPFHDYVCSSQNVAHLTIEPAVADWLLHQIGAPDG